MIKETSIPPEFKELAGRISYVVKRGAYEYSSSCPKCGGSVHQDGTPPDRFRLFVRSRALKGAPVGWCRSCGYAFIPGRSGTGSAEMSPEERARLEDERKADEASRILAEHQRIEILSVERRDIAYHQNLDRDPELRDHFYRRLITDYFIDDWRLGFCVNKHFRDSRSQTSAISPSLTIPIYKPVSRELVSIRHRLLNPISPDDKYRPEISGLPAALWSADLDRGYDGRPVLICEGEFKAATVYIALDDPRFQVVGIPGKSPDLELLAPLSGASDVIVCLDPDGILPKKTGSRTSLDRIAELRPDVRVVYLADKIDDMIVKKTLSRTSLRSLILDAKKAR